ncbi:DNA endonuclease SmrA [Endozoicomonadaceae bacterium StTr2]
MSVHDEDDLFQEALDGVRPLKGPKTVTSKQKWQGPTDTQVQRQLSAQEELETERDGLTNGYVDQVEADAVLSWCSSGVQHGVFRKLRLGQYPVDARLDLHLKTVEQARTEVFRFVRDCVQYGIRTAIIVHGKGHRNRDQPAILKSYTAKWLLELPSVLAYHSAQKQHGGAGAVYIMLKKSEQARMDNLERHQKRHR